jgi:hypothetical protein
MCLRHRNYIKNYIVSQPLLSYRFNCSSNERNEDLWIKYVVGRVCSHPNQDVHGFGESLDDIFVKITTQDLPCIVAGDINID